MLVIYDQNGIIVTKDTKKEDIVGSLNYLDVIEVPEGKVLNRVDVKVTPHVAVFVDKPKTEVELTQEQMQKLIPQLLGMDVQHNLSIKELQSKNNALEFRLGQLESGGAK